MIIFVLSLLFCISSCAPTSSGQYHQWHNPQQWHDPYISTFLQTAPIISQEPMGEFLQRNNRIVDFTNDVILVTLPHDIKAVFKCAESIDDCDDAKAEVIAYALSCSLGFPHIPPVTLRTIDGNIGSIQLFVETSLDLLLDDVFQEILQSADEHDLNNLKIFYFVCGQ